VTTADSTRGRVLGFGGVRFGPIRVRPINASWRIQREESGRMLNHYLREMVSFLNWMERSPASLPDAAPRAPLTATPWRLKVTP
jgi:hypothetical protein